MEEEIKRGKDKRQRETQTDSDGERERLTGAAEALLADAQQHGVAVVTEGWFVEVLQTPNMLPVLLHVLPYHNRTQNHFSSFSGHSILSCNTWSRRTETLKPTGHKASCQHFLLI